MSRENRHDGNRGIPPARPTPEQLRHLMESLKLEDVDVGKIVHIRPQTVREWLSGEKIIPANAWELLALYAWIVLKADLSGIASKLPEYLENRYGRLVNKDI